LPRLAACPRPRRGAEARSGRPAAWAERGRTARLADPLPPRGRVARVARRPPWDRPTVRLRGTRRPGVLYHAAAGRRQSGGPATPPGGRDGRTAGAPPGRLPARQRRLRPPRGPGGTPRPPARRVTPRPETRQHPD